MRYSIAFRGKASMWVHLPSLSVSQDVNVCIETNGTCVLPESIDWVTCSPKLGASLRVRRMDEVKVVFLGQDVSPYLQLKASSYFLQPCSCRNTVEVVEYIKSHPQWRLSLQTHKLIDIP